jgi:hypothetical protein
MPKQKNKGLLVLVAGKALQIIIMLISIRLLTTFLDKEELGQNYLLLTIVTLLNFTFWGPISQYFSRNIITWHQSEKLIIAIKSMIYIRIFTALLSVLVAFALFKFNNYERYYTEFEFLSFIFISAFGSILLLFLSTINMLGDQVSFTKLQVFSSVFSLFLSVMIVSFIDESGIGWLSGIALAQLLLAWPVYRLIAKHTGLSINKFREFFESIDLKKLYYFILPITLTLFLQWGQNFSYRFIVEANYSIELLGIMGVGFAVSTAIFSAVDNISTQYFNPIYFKGITGASNTTRANEWNKYAIRMLAIYISTLLFIASTAPFLLKLLVDEKFHNVYYFVMAGALVEFCRVSCNVIYMISQSELNTKKTVIPYLTGFAFLLVMLLNFDFSDMTIMIPIIMSCSYIIIITFLYQRMRKILNVTIDFLYLFRNLLASLPLISFMFIPNAIGSSILFSLCIVAVAGMYWVFILYVFVFKVYLKEGE